MCFFAVVMDRDPTRNFCRKNAQEAQKKGTTADVVEVHPHRGRLDPFVVGGELAHALGNGWRQQADSLQNLPYRSSLRFLRYLLVRQESLVALVR